MDRWIDADDDISARSRSTQGRVARLGLAGFVQSQGTLGTENAQTFGKIEVVQSKREQRKAEAARLMPPPPQLAAAEAVPSPIPSIPAATGPPKCPVPDWAGEPPAGSRILVYKDGQVIQEVPLVKIVTVFGRVDALADVVLDHPSISRQHATAAFHGARGTWLITDLGSTHGTFVGDGRVLAKNEPTELLPGVDLRFAASTRRYKLLPPPPAPRNAAAVASAAATMAGKVPSSSPTAAAAEAAGADAAAAEVEATGSRGQMPPPPPPKRPRVSFADGAGTGAHGGGGGGGVSGGDDGKAAPAAAASGRPRQLETVIGFSDGRDFAARVGPRTAAPAEGRFAGAVATTIVLSPKGQAVSSSSPAAAAAHAACGGGGGRGSGAEEGTVSGNIGERGGGDGGDGSQWLPGSVGRQGTATGHSGAAAAAAAEVRPQLREFVERIRKETPRGGSGRLYEQLPPPSR